MTLPAVLVWSQARPGCRQLFLLQADAEQRSWWTLMSKRPAISPGSTSGATQVPSGNHFQCHTSLAGEVWIQGSDLPCKVEVWNNLPLDCFMKFCAACSDVWRRGESHAPYIFWKGGGDPRQSAQSVYLTLFSKIRFQRSFALDLFVFSQIADMNEFIS